MCCGTGDLTFLMARRVGPRGAVTGLDFSENMLAIARRRAEALTPKSRGSWRRSRGPKGTPFPSPSDDGGDDRGFAAVSMGFALRNVGDIVQALREMAPLSHRAGEAASFPGGLAPQKSSLTGRFSHSFLPRRADFGQDGGAAPAQESPLCAASALIRTCLTPSITCPRPKASSPS